MDHYDIETVDMELEYYDLDTLESAADVRDSVVWLPDGVRLTVEPPDGESIELDFCLRYLFDWYARIRNRSSGLVPFASYSGRLSASEDEVSLDLSDRQVDSAGNERVLTERATIYGSPEAFREAFEGLIVEMFETLSRREVDVDGVLDDLGAEVGGVDVAEVYDRAVEG